MVILRMLMGFSIIAIGNVGFFYFVWTNPYAWKTLASDSWFVMYPWRNRPAGIFNSDGFGGRVDIFLGFHSSFHGEKKRLRGSGLESSNPMIFASEMFASEDSLQIQPCFTGRSGPQNREVSSGKFIFKPNWSVVSKKKSLDLIYLPGTFN